MAALVCLACTAVYSVGAPRCPQCGGKKSAEQGSPKDPAVQAVAEDDAPAEGEAGEDDA